MKSLVLLSGGMDSAVCLYQAIKDSDKVEAVTFWYGQQNWFAEYEAAITLAQEKGVMLGVIHLDIPWGITDEHTFVLHGRNGIMLAHAFGLAKAGGFDIIYGGWNAEDYEVYLDCRPVFLEKIEEALNIGVAKKGLGKRIIIKAPVQGMMKKEIIEYGNKLGVPWDLTVSCYKQKFFTDKPCGECDSCKERIAAFKEVH